MPISTVSQKQYLERAFGASQVRSNAMKLKFDYREINNSQQNVAIKVTYESDFGASPPRLNDNEDDDLVRDAYVGLSNNNKAGFATIDDAWADLMSHHTVEVDESGQPALVVDEDLTTDRYVFVDE